jgi:hypothetical protein
MNKPLENEGKIDIFKENRASATIGIKSDLRHPVIFFSVFRVSAL